MMSKMIAPTIAVSHVLTSKNSSNGSASNSTPARKPPRIAPTTPMIVVTIRPPGSSPGRIALAMIPASSPRMMKAMIPTPPPWRGPHPGFPETAARNLRHSPGIGPGDPALLHDPSVRNHEQCCDEDGHHEDTAASPAERDGDGAADDRPGETEERRQPDRHRVGAGNGQPAESADDEGRDHDQDDVAETHSGSVNE